MHSETVGWRKKLAEVARDRAAISVEEAGKILELGRTAAYGAAKRGQLPTIRLGRRVVVPVARLEAMLTAA